MASTARISISAAVEADAPALAALHAAVAEDLARRHGKGHWSLRISETGIRRAVTVSRIRVARRRGRIVGTLMLATKKPWAIDPAYFVAVKRPLYLLNMAVEPALQRRGIGRILLDEAAAIGRAWPAQSIRLDAYDAPAGAGDFYARCGYREVGRVTYRTVPLVYYELLL